MAIYSKIEGEHLVCKISNHQLVKDGETTGFVINDLKIAIKGQEIGGKIGILEFNNNSENKRENFYLFNKPTDRITLPLEFTHPIDPLNDKFEVRQIQATFSSYDPDSTEASTVQSTLPSRQKPEN
jgi:hypothetical protein